MKRSCTSGRLLRTIFLCDYFLNDVFRRELLRVLNRGEAVNALKRAIYSGRVQSHQAKHSDEIQVVADALSLLANIVMAWNSAQMQKVLDHWAQRRGGTIPPELIGRVAPTRTEGINLRGVFRFQPREKNGIVNRMTITPTTRDRTSETGGKSVLWSGLYNRSVSAPIVPRGNHP